MALPKLNDMPKYSVTVPSLNKEIRVRPFVVKEEKILLIAMESQDPKQIAEAIMDTIISCAEDPVDKHKLTSYDVEYLFMQIRSKSVGETSNVVLKCKKCQEENQVAINIGEIKINTEVPNPKIQLTNEIMVEMKSPSYLQIAQNEKVVGEKSNLMDRIFGVIIESIDSVNTADERIAFKDIPLSEQTEFLESMSPDQFTKLRQFMESQPMLRHDVMFTCEKCGVENNYNLEGLQDFF